jgi:multimeric flavodoxin WrbA
MKVIAFNGSPKKEGNTFLALEVIREELEKEGVEFELITVGNKTVKACMSCYKCAENQDGKCIIKDDVNEWIDKIREADGLLLGSPVHFAGIDGALKSFLDRAFLVAGVNGSLFRHKVGAGIVAVRRSGGTAALDQLYKHLMYQEMFIPTANYWNIIHGRTPGEVKLDDEGIQTMRVLGKNMAALLKMKKALPESELPEREDKIATHFIR